MRGAFVLATLILVGLLSIALSPGPVQRASASIASADAVGYMVTGSYFESDYVFTYTASDCIEATLSLNGALQSSYNVGCNSTGTWYGYLYAPPAAGTWTFQLVSTLTSAVEFSKSWVTPGFVMTVTSSATAASVGDTVGIDAMFTLAANGPDYLYDFGALGVTGNTTLAQDVYITMVSAHYLTYYGITANPLYGETVVMVPVSFGTAGSKTISVAYVDPYTVATGSVSLTVSDPNSARLANLQSQLNATQQNLSRLQSDLNAATAAANAASADTILVYVAVAFGLVGTALGAAGFASARKARREERARTPPSQPPQMPPPAQPPQGPPPEAPPPTSPLPPSP